MQIGAKLTKNCMQCVYIPTELPFCIPQLVVGYSLLLLRLVMGNHQQLRMPPLFLLSRPNTQPVFMYEMAHKPSRSFNEIFGKATGADQEEFGVTHGDDLFFIFKDILNITDAVATDEDKAVADQMTTMWTNFAKHQDPTPYQDGDIVAWEPFNVRNYKKG